MTTRSPAAIFVRAPTWKASLSRYAINTRSVVPCMTHNVAPVGQSKHVAVSYPLMNWLSERGVFWNSLLLFILCIANYSLVFSFNEHSRNIQMKGFGRKLSESHPTPPISLPHVAHCRSESVPTLQNLGRWASSFISHQELPVSFGWNILSCWTVGPFYMVGKWLW